MSISPILQQVNRTYVLHQGRKLSYFSGCDYFRLASHPQVLKAAGDGLKKFGLNVSASRMTTGNHELYEQLEKTLVNFFGAETATLASNGYAPNLMVAQALEKQFSHALIDEKAHGCLKDAAQLLGCPVITFKHCDAIDLAKKLKRLRKSKPLVLTDGLYSHDGSIAPLKKYLPLLPAGGMILLDDAHGAGVLGKTGRGTPEHAGVSTKRIIQTITLSKGFGVYGGAVLGSAELRQAIVARSRVFIGNTPLPLPLANAAIKSIGILKADHSLRTRLQANTAYVKAKLTAQGWAVLPNPSPIFPLIATSPTHADTLKRRLLAEGIYPPFVKYLGGPASGYFRAVFCSQHTRAQLDAFLRAIGINPQGQ